MNFLSKKRTSKYVNVIEWLCTLGVLIAMFSLAENYWSLITLGVILMLPTCYILFVGKSIDKEYEKLLENIKTINRIESWGFELEEKELIQQISWTEIERVELDSDNTLTFYRRDEKPISMHPDEYVDWYELLLLLDQYIDVPENINAYKKQLLAETEDCPVCGMKAMWEDTCLCCWTDKFDEEDLGDIYESEEDYVKEEQLDLFSTDEKGEEIRLVYDEQTSFERSRFWKPSVTVEEVKEYSRELYWD